MIIYLDPLTIGAFAHLWCAAGDRAACAYREAGFPALVGAAWRLVNNAIIAEISAPNPHASEELLHVS